MNRFYSVVLAALCIELIMAGKEPAPPVRQNGLEIGDINQCDGKDANNYTLQVQYTTDSSGNWDYESWANSPADTLTTCGHGHPKVVNTLKAIARSIYPAGADQVDETLYLVIGGNLVGKFVYIKSVWLKDSYLARASSILGSSLVGSRSLSVLISNNLDLQVVLTPTGSYELFKKGCTTICAGRGWRF